MSPDIIFDMWEVKPLLTSKILIFYRVWVAHALFLLQMMQRIDL